MEPLNQDPTGLDQKLQPKTKTALWSSALATLSDELSSAAIKTWFKNSTLQIEEGANSSIATVGCQNNFCREQIDKRYKIKLAEILSNLTNRPIEVRLSVLKNGHPKNAQMAGPLFEIPIVRPSQESTTSQRLIFDNLVVGESNRLAFAAAKAVSANPGQNYNPLFVYGNVGLGKTHLIQAIGNEIAAKNPISKVVYITCEKFTNEFIESVQTHSPKTFREKYRRVDVLLLDDVQFLSGREATQEEFFHTFNELHMSGRQVVLTSDRHPSEIGRLEDRLVSRFLGGLTVDIGQPNFEMRLGILRSKAKQMAIEAEDKVLETIASQITSNIRELEGALMALHSKADLLGQKLNSDFIKDNLIKHETVNVSPKQVLIEVCKHYKLAKSDLLGSSRKKEVVLPRQILMYLLRVKLGLSLTAIGELLSGKDHTTIMYGVAQIEQKLKDNSQFLEQIKNLESGIFKN